MFSGDANEMEQQLEQWARQAEEKAQQYQEMQNQVATVSVTESSSDGAVRLTVGAAGVITDLVLSDKIRGLDPTQLAAQIMTVMRRAQGKLADQVAAAMQSTVGDDLATVDAVVSNYQQRFPEQPTEQPPRATGAQELRLGRLDTDDDWDDPRFTR